MTRSITLPMHSALELLGGIALLVGPFLLGAGPAGMVAAISLGAVVVGLALSGPDGLPLSAHQAFDLTLVGALAGGGLSSRWLTDITQPPRPTTTAAGRASSLR